ncbi:MAG: DMT family transporter, partial [Pseudomonadota bacterium]
HFSSLELTGDLWGVLCGLFFAVYLMIGKKLRGYLNNWALIPLVYFFAAIMALIAAQIQGISLGPLAGPQWFFLLLLAIFPTIVGHSGLIYTLKHLPTSVVSIATLGEPVGAGLVAALLFQEKVTAFMLLGYLLISLGVAAVLREEHGNKQKRRGKLPKNPIVLNS